MEEATYRKPTEEEKVKDAIKHALSDTGYLIDTFYDLLDKKALKKADEEMIIETLASLKVIQRDMQDMRDKYFVASKEDTDKEDQKDDKDFLSGLKEDEDVKKEE